MPARDPVLASLDGWRQEGLIDETLHAELRVRAEAEAAQRRRRNAARFVTGTGAVLLVAAFVVLTTIFWEDLTPLIRAVFLWGVTVVVLTIGLLRMAREPTDRLGTSLVAAAMPLSLFAMVLTRQWQPLHLAATAHPAVVLAAIASAVIILAGAGLHARRNPVLPAIGLAALFAYVPVAASAFAVDSVDPVVISLSAGALGVLVLSAAVFLARPHDDVGLAPGTLEGLFWVAFAASFILVPVLWFDVIAPFDGFDNWGPILTFAALAAGAVLLGARTARNGILILGSLMVIVDAWYFGIAKGEAVGTFLALLASALVLFWLGHRLGIVGRMRGSEPAKA